MQLRCLQRHHPAVHLKSGGMGVTITNQSVQDLARGFHHNMLAAVAQFLIEDTAHQTITTAEFQYLVVGTDEFVNQQLFGPFPLRRIENGSRLGDVRNGI